MKVLMLPPYCYPEQISSSHLTEDLLETFSKYEFEVEMHAPTPCRGIDKVTRLRYKKIKTETRFNGTVHIHRFGLFAEGKNTIVRAIRYVLCNVIQFQKAKRIRDVDLIYAASTPPTQGFLCAMVKKKLSKQYGRTIPFVYNLQDVFPDSLVNAGMTKKGSLIWKIGRRIEDHTYQNADRIIVISEDFKANIMGKGVPEEKIVVVPNWINTDNVYPIDRNVNILFDKYGLDRSLFYICYSGNIGHSQNMDLLLEVAKDVLLELPDVRFVIIGEGASKNEINRRIINEQISNIIILPFQDYGNIAHVFSLGDVGLIISKPGIGGSSVPSKTFSIMAAERPILASFDGNSALANFVRTERLGIVAEAGEKGQLIDAILKMRTNVELRKTYGCNGRNYLLSHLSKEVCTKQYVEVIKSTVG